MKRNTRQEILCTAKQMFNERGYNAVSIGNIATTLGISKGNLTYHFKKKEEIMEALINSGTPDFTRKVPDSLEEMDGFLVHLQQVRDDNAFYFWNHAQLAQLSSQIKEKQIEIYRFNYGMFTKSLQLLEEKRLIRQEAICGEYTRLSDTLLMMSIYWLPFQDLIKSVGKNEDFRTQAWALIYPLLTSDGVEIFKELHVFS